MKKWLLIPLLILIFALALVLPRFYYYQGEYLPPPVATPSVGEIFIPTPTPAVFAETEKQGQGILVIDLAHDNWLAQEELALLTQRVLARGYRVEFLRVKIKRGDPEDVRSQKLEEKLRQAQALAVVLPWEAYSLKEARLVQDFVDKGGKVLLVADPTRPSKINSLAQSLGITFQNDYLYNQIENDGNFRDVFFSQFKDSEISLGLKRIALYTTSSLSPSSWGVALADANTHSSGIATSGLYSPVLLRPDGLVLALGDFTFLSEPYNSAADNNQFVSNIADWLTTSLRRFSLGDFPHFLDKKPRLEVAQAELLNQGLELKRILGSQERQPQIVEFKGQGNFAFLGLFEDGGKVESYLQAGNISIEIEEVKEERKVQLLIAGLGDVYRPGSALVYLYQKQGQTVLILLGDDEEALEAAVTGLDTGEFRDWLINDSIALLLPPKEEEQGTGSLRRP